MIKKKNLNAKTQRKKCKKKFKDLKKARDIYDTYIRAGKYDFI